MQLSIDVIDAMRASALYIGGVLSEATIPVNKFMDSLYGGISLPRYKFSGDTLICYTGSGEIRFKDVRPHKVIALDITEPVEFNTQREDYVLDTYRNAKSTPFSEEETYTEEHIHTVKTDIMAALETAIKSKVGASYAGFSGELESSLTAKLGVNHSDEQVDKHGATQKMTIDVAPWTSVSVSQEHDITDVSEIVSLVCQLDAGVSIHGGWDKYFDSLYELTIYMRGGGTGGTSDLDGFVATRKFEHFDLDSECYAMKPIDPRRYVNIEEERISRNVKTGKIVMTETPIKHV